MRITDLDKRRAIKRFPEFEKDCRQYDKLKKLRSEDEITQFKIDFLKRWGYEFEQILNADEMAKSREDTPSIAVIDRITDEPYSFTYTGEEKASSHLHGKSLYLRVDVKGKTETQLVEDFKRAIKPYRDLLQTAKNTGERNRKTGIEEGIFLVYDLYLEMGKSWVETTRRWFDLSPAVRVYDDKESLLKQIKTAVSNAKTIIASVRKEYRLK